MLRPPATPPEAELRQRNERMERREQLYAVVRDTMVRAGILSASYKFKVLALDQRGHQFLVMMDLAREYGSETAHLSSIEGVIAQGARTRHAIAVTAVYWRINDQIPSIAALRDGMPQDGVVSSRPAPLVASAPAAPPVAGMAPLPSRTVAPAPVVSAPVVAAKAAAAATVATGLAQPRSASRTDFVPAPADRLVAPRFDPIEAEEVAAFRQALAGAATSVPAVPGVAVHSGPRRASFSESEFPDTQLPDDYEPRPRGSDLSNTQYGDL